MREGGRSESEGGGREEGVRKGGKGGRREKGRKREGSRDELNLPESVNCNRTVVAFGISLTQLSSCSPPPHPQVTIHCTHN